MPGKTKIIAQITTMVNKFITIIRAVWSVQKTIYIAAGLLLVSGMMILTVAGALKSAHNGSGKPQNLASFPPTASATVEPAAGVSADQPVQPAEAIPEPIYHNIQQPESSSAMARQVNVTTNNDSPVFSWPLKGEIKLEFGWQQHPVFGDWRYHTGIDISGQEGENVHAVHDGEVTDIYNDKHYGLTVVVTSSKYVIYYGSLVTAAVSKNAHITPGDNIGSIGKCSDEPYEHLHLSIKKDGKFLDPLEILQ